MEENPVLVEKYRACRIETEHRGTIVLVDSKKKIQLKIGNYQKRVFPRSSAKVFQALCCLEQEIDTFYKLNKKEIAFLVGSHNGTKTHTKVAESICQKANISPKALACGKDFPWFKKDCLSEKSKVITSTLQHQCSGKHLGMLMLAKKNGFCFSNLL